MKRIKIVNTILILVLGVVLMAGTLTGCGPKKNPIVTMVIKDYGTVTIELYPDVAPITVSNFVTLANSGYYDGLIFHRVISGFMIQGGDKDGTGYGQTSYTIKGEFSANGVKNDLEHTPGVISMARSKKNDTACSQFFICVGTPYWLDGSYAAFGKVTSGMDIVYAISEVETNPSNDKPLVDVVMESVRVETFGVDYSKYDKISAS